MSLTHLTPRHFRAASWLASLLLLSSPPLLAQPTLRITSPVDGTIVHPGESLKVTVEAPPVGVLPNVLLIGWGPLGMFRAVGSPPYQFVVPVPKTIAPGPYRLTAAGTSPSQGKNPIPVESKPITILVERADEPVRLEVFPPTISLQPGRKGFLSVTGIFADRQKVDLKLSSKTIYSSDTPRVVTVEPNSVVHRRRPRHRKNHREQRQNQSRDPSRRLSAQNEVIGVVPQGRRSTEPGASARGASPRMRERCSHAEAEVSCPRGRSSLGAVLDRATPFQSAQRQNRLSARDTTAYPNVRTPRAAGPPHHLATGWDRVPPRRFAQGQSGGIGQISAGAHRRLEPNWFQYAALVPALRVHD